MHQEVLRINNELGLKRNTEKDDAERRARDATTDANRKLAENNELKEKMATMQKEVEQLNKEANTVKLGSDIGIPAAEVSLPKEIKHVHIKGEFSGKVHAPGAKVFLDSCHSAQDEIIFVKCRQLLVHGNCHKFEGECEKLWVDRGANFETGEIKAKYFSALENCKCKGKISYYDISACALANLEEAEMIKLTYTGDEIPEKPESDERPELVKDIEKKMGEEGAPTDSSPEQEKAESGLETQVLDADELIPPGETVVEEEPGDLEDGAFDEGEIDETLADIGEGFGDLTGLDIDSLEGEDESESDEPSVFTSQTVEILPEEMDVLEGKNKEEKGGFIAKAMKKAGLKK